MPTVAEGQPGVVATAAGSGSSADNSGAGTLSVWTYLPPDDPSVKAYLREFQKKNPNIKVKYTAYPEDNYVTKVNTALQAHNPPDIAIIEDRSWMKANKVVELTPHLNTWGVNPADFNPGGMGRAAPEGDIAQGVYAVGDFLGGNVLFYNKDLFDKAGLEYPPTNKSLSMQEYADICRKIAKPDPNPAKAVYGCSAPFGASASGRSGSSARTATRSSRT
ncbi:MAG: extracellular solute-binding protein [Chloroflexia bacterium]